MRGLGALIFVWMMNYFEKYFDNRDEKFKKIEYLHWLKENGSFIEVIRKINEKERVWSKAKGVYSTKVQHDGLLTFSLSEYEDVILFRIHLEGSLFFSLDYHQKLSKFVDMYFYPGFNVTRDFFPFETEYMNILDELSSFLFNKPFVDKSAKNEKTPERKNSFVDFSDNIEKRLKEIQKYRHSLTFEENAMLDIEIQKKMSLWKKTKSMDVYEEMMNLIHCLESSIEKSKEITFLLKTTVVSKR